MGFFNTLRGVLAYVFGQRIETRCPFCGRRFIADTSNHSVIHQLPACLQFAQAEDSLAFLQAVNKENARQRKEKRS